MKCVILAGGLGTRLSEETDTRPKPMVEIGGRPILWHIMKLYSSHGITDFIICLGYKGYLIKEFFMNYSLHMSTMTIDMKEQTTQVHGTKVEPWKVTLVDTGDETMTGGRLKRVFPYLNGETFLMTYGDGLSDINIHETLSFHKKHGKLATLAAVQPPGRFGALQINSGSQIVENFVEKPRGDSAYINGGFFVLEPQIEKFLGGDSTVWEQEPLQTLASEKQLVAYKHDGFWHAMDTLRDKRQLEQLWSSGTAPWKGWKD